MTEAMVGALTCVFATIALALIDISSRVDAHEVGGRVILSHGLGWRGLAGLVTVMFSVGTVLLVGEAISDGFDGRFLLALLFVTLFLAIGLWMVSEGRRQYILDEVGIHFGTPSCTAHTIPWASIRSVEYLPVWEHIAVRDAGGGVVRISRYMRGTHHLWLLLERHVEPSIWSAANRKWGGQRGHPTRKP